MDNASSLNVSLHFPESNNKLWLFLPVYDSYLPQDFSQKFKKSKMIVITLWHLEAEIVLVIIQVVKNSVCQWMWERNQKRWMTSYWRTLCPSLLFLTSSVYRESISPKSGVPFAHCWIVYSSINIFWGPTRFQTVRKISKMTYSPLMSCLLH